MIKVAHIVTRINFGGLTTFLYNYYEHIDRSKISFDIITIDTGYKHDYDEKFVDLGSEVLYMPDNLIQRAKYLFQLFKKKKYDVVHVHIEVQSGMYLLLAKLSGIKVRIAHAHWSRENKGLKNSFLRFILNRVVTLRAGASQLAIDAVFGEKYGKFGKVINNAVDLDSFKFSESVRTDYRRELQIEHNFVLGFVGRLTYQKNILFIIQVFDEIQKIRPDAKLMIVGDGEDAEMMLSELKKRSILNKLLWLKTRNDVSQLFCAMDVMLLPSHYEGLPLVLVESQACSVHAIVSEAVTKQVNLTSFIHYLPIESSNISSWASLALSIGNEYERFSTKDEISMKGFSIKLEANKLLNLYGDLLNNSH